MEHNTPKERRLADRVSSLISLCVYAACFSIGFKWISWELTFLMEYLRFLFISDQKDADCRKKVFLVPSINYFSYLIKECCFLRENGSCYPISKLFFFFHFFIFPKSNVEDILCYWVMLGL